MSSCSGPNGDAYCDLNLVAQLLSVVRGPASLQTDDCGDQTGIVRFLGGEADEQWCGIVRGCRVLDESPEILAARPRWVFPS